MGCHVEYQTGIPTVGVAKKMPFAFNEYCDDSESFNKVSLLSKVTITLSTTKLHYFSF